MGGQPSLVTQFLMLYELVFEKLNEVRYFLKYYCLVNLYITEGIFILLVSLLNWSAGILREYLVNCGWWRLRGLQAGVHSPQFETRQLAPREARQRGRPDRRPGSRSSPDLSGERRQHH